ncbi:MAG: UDP-N-acetylmuramoyl-tripeptide--D-alanyl-D-alanine ligase [Elusimicrobia bacterium]|nr:MAG: UDP-N-acetylmuramoyl-tripeptide--D-alanyl-D-alanine ligase [Elusimicrobiota bacterium]
MKLGMTIAGLAEAAGGRVLKGDPLRPFDVFVTDTRRLMPADFFWALKGVSHDAHDFLSSALARRPSGWLVREGAGANGAPPVVITVPDTLRALQSLAARHRRRFALPLVAISGSNGKTTTKEMLRAVFAEAGETCASRASFNNHFGLPLSLLELTERHKYAVLELGASRRGEIRELCSIAAPGIGVLTNISPEHLEYFGDMETVFKAETELAECLSADGTLVYNCDDPFLARLGVPSKRTMTFGGSEKADVRILPGEKLLLEHRGAREEIELPVPCAHNFYNAAGAAAAALAAGLDLALIKRGLESHTPPTMRMQELRFGGAAVILDAYNANPASMAAARRACFWPARK